jgi:RHH-type proline utilization regulon transcriptional repressor/proline dehydrogenase/delta 1-pyrroline-5-carboxylate dehydrogenase
LEVDVVPDNPEEMTGGTATGAPRGSVAGGSPLPPRIEIARHYLAPEHPLVASLADAAAFGREEGADVGARAGRLVEAVRRDRARHGGIDAFLQEYGLTSEEGVILMCLAEALLRIPDAETADQLIAEKIGSGNWDRHLGHSDNLFVNASTWGLMLTGNIVRLGKSGDGGPLGLVKRVVSRAGEPVIRQAVRQAMRIMGDQFVLGRTIEEALGRAADFEAQGVRFSYDMLGEGARTANDARRYYDRYANAIEAIGKAAGPVPDECIETLMERPGISVKLSAIHPRFEAAKTDRLMHELVPRLVALGRLARRHGLTLTVDAEEQDRLEIGLEVFARAFCDPALAEWPGLGLAVQAYGRRAIPVLAWLRELSERVGKRMPVRLVKGAYWDSEIKWAQERGLASYPVFTEKSFTDVSYMAAVRMLFDAPHAFYPQLATHNAHTVAAVSRISAGGPFEFQRLHGMGEALYAAIASDQAMEQPPVRVYAPVGGHEDLLAYLVRRLLENGANTSFVHRLADDRAPVAEIVKDPVTVTRGRLASEEVAVAIPAPSEIFLPARRNSEGLALTEASVRAPLLASMHDVLAQPFHAGAIVDGRTTAAGAGARTVVAPHDHTVTIGTVQDADASDVDRAIKVAQASLGAWDRLGGGKRSEILERAADLLEQDRPRLMAAIVREAGKTLETAHGDIREAVDFLRYYASEARRLFDGSVRLPGPTGERNSIALRARGPFACISPWNFPIAIFVGQVAAALAAGNTVLAKPAEQTPITAFLAVGALHRAGVPPGVLHLLPGDGKVGAALTGDTRIKGVAFTGSNETSWAIQMALAKRRADIVPFIAETGGINAMIADSTALAEQVVRDAVRSAFDSAGQRCSAARVLFLHEDVAEHTIDMLRGAVEELALGDPLDYATDIGPVIDEDARQELEAHKSHMRASAKTIVDLALPETCRAGTYVGPAVYEIDRPGRLDKEVFGPILHVVRYESGHLDKVVEAINATGFGLTLGLHSRIAGVADYVAAHAKVGNLYVNRNQIGAVVGAQPFGGEGLSGTGPKAGGPNYLVRFATERVRSTDVTATGGNVELLGLGQS